MGGDPARSATIPLSCSSLARDHPAQAVYEGVAPSIFGGVWPLHSVYSMRYKVSPSSVPNLPVPHLLTACCARSLPQLRREVTSSALHVPLTSA